MRKPSGKIKINRAGDIAKPNKTICPNGCPNSDDPATKEAYELINNKHHFILNTEQWNKFCNALNTKPNENKALQKLLNSKGVFDE